MKWREMGRANVALYGLILLEVSIFFLLVFSIFSPYVEVVVAGVGEDNVTVITLLDVGNVFPEILNVTINDADSSLDLSANSTVSVNVYVIARDYNGEDDIQNITMEFFDSVASSYGSADDNNDHYTNNSCVIDTGYGDVYEVSANCTTNVYYYAHNSTWNATVLVTDNATLTGSGSDTIVVNTLLAFALPDSIDYGEVNATAVSSEQIANVTNAGNVMLNLSLSGYAATVGDGWAMNCTLGSVQNISIEYEKYNLTISNDSVLTLPQFEGIYENLTSAVVTKQFDLDYRRNDTSQFIDDTNATYWRIYVPIGVAGTCSGNIVFGAVQAPES